jgi:hypothetical protein
MKEKMIVKPKFFKVMKQKIFTLIMMLALVIVAGSAFAQGKFTPNDNSTYSYSISYDFGAGGSGSGVLSVSNSTALTISNQNPSDLSSLTGSGNVTFDIDYADGISGSYTITLELTDAGTGHCTNKTVATVTINPTPPTIDLVISTAEGPVCQNVTGTANNVAASTGRTNTILYTITPTTTAGAGYSYAFNFAATPAAFGSYSYAKASGTGTVNPTTGAVTGANGPIGINVTWTTTTALGESAIVGTISNTTAITSPSEGSKPFNGTQSVDDVSVTIHSTPSVGSFN